MDEPRCTSDPEMTEAQWRVLFGVRWPLKPGERVALGDLGERLRVFAPDGRCVLLLVADPKAPGYYGEPRDVLVDVCRDLGMEKIRDWSIPSYAGTDRYWNAVGGYLDRAIRSEVERQRKGGDDGR